MIHVAKIQDGILGFGLATNFQKKHLFLLDAAINQNVVSTSLSFQVFALTCTYKWTDVWGVFPIPHFHSMTRDNKVEGERHAF